MYTRIENSFRTRSTLPATTPTTASLDNDTYLQYDYTSSPRISLTNSIVCSCGSRMQSRTCTGSQPSLCGVEGIATRATTGRACAQGNGVMRWISLWTFSASRLGLNGKIGCYWQEQRLYRRFSIRPRYDLSLFFCSYLIPPFKSLISGALWFTDSTIYVGWWQACGKTSALLV